MNNDIIKHVSVVIDSWHSYAQAYVGQVSGDNMYNFICSIPISLLVMSEICPISSLIISTGSCEAESNNNEF